MLILLTATEGFGDALGLEGEGTVRWLVTGFWVGTASSFLGVAIFESAFLSGDG